jgi:hypothetical protein
MNILFGINKAREHMVTEIRAYFDPHIQKLVDFIDKHPDYVKIPENAPMYLDKFNQVIQYKDLDKEVKIGKYFARMWLRNVNEIMMPYEECENVSSY